MKVVIYIFSIVLILFVISVGLIYKSESFIPTESELSKYPELIPFLAGRTGFRGIRFDLDTNYYSFSFPTSLGSAERYYLAVESEKDVIKAGWSLAESNGLSHMYVRKKSLPVGSLQLEKVTLFYNSKTNVVTLVREEF